MKWRGRTNDRWKIASSLIIQSKTWKRSPKREHRLAAVEIFVERAVFNTYLRYSYYFYYSLVEKKAHENKRYDEDRSPMLHFSRYVNLQD